MRGVGLVCTWSLVTRKEALAVSPRQSLREVGRCFVRGFWALMIPLIIVGGIKLGVFTPTEAGGVGASGAFILGLIRRKLNRANIREALLQAQRYPQSYDGIVAGEPVVDYSNVIQRGIALAKLAFSNNGAGWLSPAKIKLFGDAQMAACDGLDGAVDGKRVEMTRPLCRYPTWPKYRGAGDQNLAASFSCAYY